MSRSWRKGLQSAIWTCLHRGKHLMAEDWKLWPKAFQSLGACSWRSTRRWCVHSTATERLDAVQRHGTAWPSTQHVDARSGHTQNGWVHIPGSRLVVLAGEVGGRWSAETAMFLRLIAKANARTEPPVLRLRAELAWRARWGSILACAAARALAWSLLGLCGGPGANGDTPETHDVIRKCGHSLGVPD